MTVTDLVQQSGDSILLNWSYQANQLKLTIELSEIDTRLTLFIRSKWLSIDVADSSVDKSFRTCFVEVIELKQLLAEKHGVYVPASEFGHFMQEKRKNLNLAYGLKVNEYKYIFSLVGSNRLISCIISDLTQIIIPYTAVA